MDYILNFVTYEGNFLNRFSKRCAFDCCLVVTFLPVNARDLFALLAVSVCILVLTRISTTSLAKNGKCCQ